MNTHKTKIQLRFADIDLLGHVNNARFASFMEIARVQFFRDVMKRPINWTEDGLIVARLETDFLIPVFFQDQLIVEAWVSQFGQKSFTVEYRFVVEGDAGPILKAMGKSVMVAFSYKENRSIPIPEWWIEQIEAFQQGK